MDLPKSPEPGPLEARSASRNVRAAAAGFGLAALLLIVGSSAARSPEQGDSISAVIAAHAAATPTLTPSGQPGSGTVGGPVPHVGSNLVTVGPAAVSGTTVSEFVACPSSAATICAVTLKLTVVETLTNGKLTAVTAARKKRTATVGIARWTISPGHGGRLKVKLNGTGKRLLSSRGKLSATLTTTQAVPGAGSVAVRRQVVRFKTH